MIELEKIEQAINIKTSELYEEYETRSKNLKNPDAKLFEFSHYGERIHRLRDVLMLLRDCELATNDKIEMDIVIESIEFGYYFHGPD